MRIEILVFPGVDEQDALGPFEVLRNASSAGADFSTRLVTLEGEPEITGAHGLQFCSQGSLGSSGLPDILVVPGGGWNDRAPQGTWAEAQRGLIPQAIARCYREGSMLASVCTGAMLLANTGILRGRHATTHHGAIEQLREAGANVVEARVVDDGDIITAGGVTSGLDLALWLVERFAGRPIAAKVEKEMEYERRLPLWTRAQAAEARA
jgi:transcriptional regulator GlxA family with amidase domain